MGSVIEFNIGSVIIYLKKVYGSEIIKWSEIVPLMNLRTAKQEGVQVQLQLSTKYHYSETFLADIKKQLQADDYFVIVEKCRLKVIFNKRYPTGDAESIPW